ncbi:MAG: MCP four helix bundle domain-containing protein, partial [Syntrophorhabdaceae bacterium]|nr:MCP four helix bundle domain-containing protein [Syntrophorhabdaceae bacterium]
MHFKNMRIGMRLGIGFGIMMVLLAVLTFMGIRSMHSINGGMETIVKESNVKIKCARDAMKAIDKASEGILITASINDTGIRAEAKKDINEGRKAYKENVELLEKIDGSQTGKQLLQKAKTEIKLAAEANNRTLQLAAANKAQEAVQVYVKEGRPNTEKVKGSFVEIARYQEEQAMASYNEAMVTYKSTRTMLLIIGLVAVVLGVVVAYFMTCSITGPLGEAVHVANDLAEGNLAVNVEIKSEDETGKLLMAMKDMVAKLREVVEGVSAAGGN